MAQVARILLFDPAGESSIAELLEQEGIQVSVARSTQQAVETFERTPIDAVLANPQAADATGLRLEVLVRWPDVPLVALTESADAGANAIKQGAVEYATLSAEREELVLAVKKALARAEQLAAELPTPHVESSGLIGSSRAMESVRQMIERVASGSASVLVRGETGTGKELVARAVHEQSPRQPHPFVKVHLAALPDSLLESELFGYERGAFTGASSRKPGRVELAESGTLFMDEIAEISPMIQAKLLRLLQDREYERLGGTGSLKANVRFVAATHRDLEHMVERKEFRQDLFYRLNVVTIWLPPLRARRSDVIELARHFLAELGPQNGKPDLDLDPEAGKLLASQRWPGNVRQLLNFVERLVLLTETDSIGKDLVRRELEEQPTFATQSTFGSEAPMSGIEPSPDSNLISGPPSSLRPLREELRLAERRALLKALTIAKGNRTLAARLLGVSRRTFYTKLDEHGIG